MSMYIFFWGQTRGRTRHKITPTRVSLKNRYFVGIIVILLDSSPEDQSKKYNLYSKNLADNW
jgi:hypothetical protein